MWDQKLSGNNISFLESEPTKTTTSGTSVAAAAAAPIVSAAAVKDFHKKHIDLLSSQSSSANVQDSGYLSGPLTYTSESDIIIDNKKQCYDQNRIDIDDIKTENSSQLFMKGGECNIQQQLTTYSDSGVIEDFKESFIDYSSGSVSATTKEIIDEQRIDEEDNQMIIENNVDVGLSEWFCNLNIKNQSQPLNNLGDYGAKPKTKGKTFQTTEESLIVAKKQQEHQELWKRCYKQDDEGDTSLHLAIIGGLDYTEIIFSIIRLAPHPYFLDIRNDSSKTALHLAVHMALPNVIRRLLIFGANASIRDTEGNTALHLACMKNDIECVQALLEPIHINEFREAHKLTDRTIQYIYPCTKLPPDFEIRNYSGENCVHLATQRNNKDILRLLLRNGADINAREGKAGYTPLHIAIENQNEQMVTFILEQSQINIEQCTYGRLTAYQFAACLKNDKILMNLEKYGAEQLSPPQSSDEEDNNDDDDDDDDDLDSNDEDFPLNY